MKHILWKLNESVKLDQKGVKQYFGTFKSILTICYLFVKQSEVIKSYFVEDYDLYENWLVNFLPYNPLLLNIFRRKNFF